jgi:uncharacterized protein YoxC
MISSTGDPSAAAPDTGASIDKVRDILFGNQVREFERRFARLEERIIKETNDLKEDVRSRVEALEQYTKKEMESLADHLKADHDERVESDASLARRITALDEQAAKGQRELRQQILEQHQRLSDDIRKKMDEVLATLAHEAQSLRSDKADRATLAALLTEMAMRLTNDFQMPDVEEAGNA